MKQLSLFPNEFSKSFGGSILKGKRKSARTLSSQHPIHLVLRSSKAHKSLSFANNRSKLDRIYRACAQKWGIKIYGLVWNFDHVHAVIKIPNRTLYINWIREVTGAIAAMLGAKDFFDERPFTRIVEWGRDLRNAKDYLELNDMERFGQRPQKKPPS